MIRILKQRFLLALILLLSAAALGALAGFLAEGMVAYRSTERQLAKDASSLLAESDSVIRESRSVLDSMNASTYPFCSEAELYYFRKLIFDSEYLHDAGRMVSGNIACSVTHGRENLPAAQFTAAARMPKNTTLYKSFSPYQSGQENIYGLSSSDSYVVIDPRFSLRRDSINKNRALTTFDPVSHKPIHPLRQLPHAEEIRSDVNWQGRVGNTMAVTRCSVLGPSCMTTYADFSSIFGMQRSQYIIYSSLGGVIGSLFGYACLLLYNRSRNMAQQLRRAIRRDRLRVAYQPIVELRSRRIVGAEALARWTDEEGFTVSPDVFVKIAEEAGYVGEITRLVLRHALRDFGEMLRSQPAFQLGINVTATDLHDSGFVSMVEKALQREGVSARSLVAEITESSTVQHDLSVEMIERLHQLGLGVYIDDFGTGYSSLSYLHALSVDAIKIDKSFTHAIGTEAVTVSILPQILAMAETLKLRVIVEGIETEAQADYFRGVTQPIFAQGWYFGRPVPAEQFHALLACEDTRAVPVYES